MERNDLIDTAFQLEELNPGMLVMLTPERIALIEHCDKLALVLREIFKNESTANTEELDKESQEIIDLIGISPVLANTLEQADVALKELRRVYEKANNGKH